MNNTKCIVHPPNPSAFFKVGGLLCNQTQSYPKACQVLKRTLAFKKKNLVIPKKTTLGENMDISKKK